MTTHVDVPGISLRFVYIFLLLLAQSKDWDSQNGYTESPSECIQLPCTFWSDLQPGSWLFIALCKRCVSRTPQWFNVIIWIHLNHFALRGVFLCIERGVSLHLEWYFFSLGGVFLCIWRGCFFLITFIALLQLQTVPFGID